VTRWFGRNRRRGARPVRRALTLAAWRVARVGVPLLVVLVGWPAIRERVREHPYFALRELTVQRRGHVTEEAIRRVTGLTPGMSIWQVDAQAIQTQTETHSATTGNCTASISMVTARVTSTSRR